jgi:hypothetical protein
LLTNLHIWATLHLDPLPILSTMRSFKKSCLKDVYGDVENAKFWTGLMGNDILCEAIMSKELTKFVANDAFNQALCCPLLSEHAFNDKDGPRTFSNVGWALINREQRIASILERNIKGGELTTCVGMTDPEYKIPLSLVTTKILKVISLIPVVAVVAWLI